MRKISFVAITSLCAIAASQAVYAKDGTFSLSTGIDYNSGKYGGPQATDILYIPVTAKYQTDLWTLKLTVPYIAVNGSSNVVPSAGGEEHQTTATTSTRSGLGDVILGVGRNVYYDSLSGFLVNLTGKVKFATASSSDNLGTGKEDYSLQVDLYKLVGSATVFGTVGYKVYGQPATYTLYNSSFGSLGASHKFNEATSGGIILNASTHTTAGGSDHEEGLLFVDHWINKNRKAEYYLQKGFTTSVPDYGLGVSVSYYY
jgi:hypothetical protein